MPRPPSPGSTSASSWWSASRSGTTTPGPAIHLGAARSARHSDARIRSGRRPQQLLLPRSSVDTSDSSSTPGPGGTAGPAGDPAHVGRRALRGLRPGRPGLHGDPARLVAAAGQAIAFAPVARGGDTMLPTDQLQFRGEASLGTSDPHLVDATVQLSAVEQLSPVGPVTIKLAQTYLDHGFGGAANAGEVWAELVGAPPNLSFGGSTTAGSDSAGGFLQPDMPIRGLSRIKGTVGDVAGTATSGFDPSAFLAGALPKLFGIVPLVDLLDAAGVDLDDAPESSPRPSTGSRGSSPTSNVPSRLHSTRSRTRSSWSIGRRARRPSSSSRPVRRCKLPSSSRLLSPRPSTRLSPSSPPWRTPPSRTFRTPSPTLCRRSGTPQTRWSR